MIKTLLLIAGILLAGILSGQNKLTTKSRKAIEYYNNGLTAFNEYRFTDAITQLGLAIQTDSEFLEAYLVRAEVYETVQDVQSQITDLLAVEKRNETFYKYLYYNLGDAHYNNGQYLVAIGYLNKYKLQKDIPPHSLNRADILMMKCQQAIVLMQNPVTFNPLVLSDAINDENDQYWPSLSVDGNTMVYTVLFTDSTRVSRFGELAKQEDFYVSQKEDGIWQPGKPLGNTVNTPGNEGAQSISADGTTLVFTGCGRKDGFGKCDIYISHFLNGAWTVPVNMGPQINSPFSDKQPCLSPDGQALYFVSDRPGGFGNLDIWSSRQKADGKWETPINLGSELNTEADEASPFLHPDNQTFYYSSDGLIGLGKKDIFITKRTLNGKWEKPRNIGYPINTYRDEIGLVVDASGTTAYYSTNYNSKSRNIVSFEMPQSIKPTAVSYVKGKIYDALTIKPLEARFFLQELGSGDTVMRAVSDAVTGQYLVCLPAGQNYSLNVKQEGYLFYTLNFNLTDTNTALNPLLIDIGLTKIQTGEKAVLNNIFFETDSYELKPESQIEIENLAKFIAQNPGITFEVGGHTDNSGTKEHNLTLSEKRAQTVYDSLIKAGVYNSALTFKGYGQNEPVADNNSEVNKAKNRRTELKIVKITQ